MLEGCSCLRLLYLLRFICWVFVREFNTALVFVDLEHLHVDNSILVAGQGSAEAHTKFRARDAMLNLFTFEVVDELDEEIEWCTRREELRKVVDVVWTVLFNLKHFPSLSPILNDISILLLRKIVPMNLLRVLCLLATLALRFAFLMCIGVDKPLANREILLVLCRRWHRALHERMIHHFLQRWALGGVQSIIFSNKSLNSAE